LVALLSPAPGGAASSDEGVLIAAAGDISCPAALTAKYSDEFNRPGFPLSEMRCQGHRVARLIASARPRYALAVGDLIQDQTSTARAYLDFGRAWGGLGTRIMPSIGNHDYLRQSDGTMKPSGYFDYWQRKGTPAWKIGRRNQGWTSWNLGSWHMINLNSNCDRIDCSFSGAQARWLLHDLKTNRKGRRTRCILAYFHHPRFSAGVPLGRTGDRTLLVNLWELLYRFRADLVVTGHQQYYERYLPENPVGRRDATGIAQFITGTGGASLFPVVGAGGRRSPNSVAAKIAPGATFFRLNRSSYSWEFRDIKGGTYDASSSNVACHKPAEGGRLRRPRNERYLAHEKQMVKLNGAVRRAKLRVRRLIRRKAAPARVRTSRRSLRRISSRRAKVRVQRLY
jgi:hypothetical protein